MTRFYTNTSIFEPQKSWFMSLLEQPWRDTPRQGKRNPSKMVSVAREHQRADTLKPYLQKTSQSDHTRTTALYNSVKPSHACEATQDGRVMVERPDRMWSTGEENGKPLQYSCLENPMNSRKRQRTGRPGVLWFWGRKESDMTERLNGTELIGSIKSQL